MAKKELDFLKGFNKDVSKIEGISLSAQAPKFWISTGSHVINKIISGSYQKGIPQGRLALIAGPSGAGKSFIMGNIAKAALAQEIGVFVIDSENALDDQFMLNIGADILDNPLYDYKGVQKISQAIKLISTFTKNYRESGTDQPFLIIIDSLDMLQTDSTATKYDSGEIANDQGQHAKQIKGMLQNLVQDCKSLNIAIVCSKHVYQEQDAIASKQMPWRLTEAVKFAFSQILLVEKLLLKDKESSTFEGIQLKAWGLKTRFGKPFQRAKIEVPYETGMDPYTGMLDAAEAMGIVVKNGGWYTYGTTKFTEKESGPYIAEICEKIFAMDDETMKLDAVIDAEVDMTDVKTEDEIRAKRQRKSKKSE
jgi:RecA/RadA recombinase